MRIPSQLNYALEVLGMPHCLVDFIKCTLVASRTLHGNGLSQPWIWTGARLV